MKPWEAAATRNKGTMRIPKHLSPEERAKHESAAANAAAESKRYAAEADEELSVGGRIKGTLAGIGREMQESNYGLDYIQDYGKGIVDSLREADQGPVGMGDVLLGVGAPAVEYPAAMAAGAAALPFSGDYGGVRDQAFENLDGMVQTPGSKGVQGVAGAVLKPIGDLFHTAGRGIGEIAGAFGMPEEFQENVADMGEDALGFIGVKGKMPVGTPGINPGPPKRAPVTRGPTADPLARARDAGYTLPASARGPDKKPVAGKGARLAETVGGKKEIAHKGDQKNDLRVLDGIRKDLGLDSKIALTKPVFDAIRTEAGTVYDAVRNAIPALPMSPKLQAAIDAVGEGRRNNPLLAEAPDVGKLRERVGNAGTVETGQVMTAIQEFRDNARLVRQAAERAEKPELAVQKAEAYREMADTLEAGLDEALTASGRPDLIPSLVKARQRLAKVHQAEEVVSGKKRPGVALMDMKQHGEFLSGEMDLAADVHRDMLPTQDLSVDVGSTIDPNIGGLPQMMQTVLRTGIGPALNSEFMQRRMFGARQPESLTPYQPKPDAVPAPRGPDGPTGSGSVDFEGSPNVPPTAALRPGERMEFARDESGDGSFPAAEGRIGDLTVSDPPVMDGVPFEPTDLIPEGNLTFGGESGGFPGARVPEEAALVEFETNQPLERRRGASRDLGEGERRSSIMRERQAVLDRPIGTKDQGIADQLLADPEMRAAVDADSRSNRLELHPDDQMPPNLTDREMLDLQLQGEGAYFDQPPGRAARIADEVPESGDAAVQAAIDRLEEIGFSPAEIAEILRSAE